MYGEPPALRSNNMAASACRRVGHFCRQIISAFRDLKNVSTEALS